MNRKEINQSLAIIGGELRKLGEIYPERKYQVKQIAQDIIQEYSQINREDENAYLNLFRKYHDRISALWNENI